MKEKRDPQGCVLCQIVAENNDRASYILYRGKTSYMVLNVYPYNNGHLMVVPYKHTPSIEDLDAETLSELMTLAKKAVQMLRRLMKPEGFNIGVNIGKASGAGFDEHVHVHIVPRWAGDSNFMTVTGNTRIIPELLGETYEKLRSTLVQEDN